MMTEQSKTDGQWFAYYSGTFSEFRAAGVPPAAFPSAGEAEKSFRLQVMVGGFISPLRFSGHVLEATMRADQGRYELEVCFGLQSPTWFDAGHPLIDEMARMLLIDVMYWTEPPRDGDPMEAPAEKLADDERAADYHHPRERRFRFTPEFRSMIKDLPSLVFQRVKLHGEVLPADDEHPAPGAKRPCHLRLV